MTEHGAGTRESASDAHLGHGDHGRRSRSGPCPKPSTGVFAWFQRVDDIFSTWRADSEISRLSRRELTLREVSAELRTVLELCDQVSEDSHGAFDIYVGADPRVEPREGLGPIDPSGLVKGWALQRAAEDLRRAGADQLRHQRRRRRDHRRPTTTR